MRIERWVGRWIMTVGVLHLPVALVKHHAAWRDVAAAGVFDVVQGHVARGHAAWFLVAGLLLLLLGAQIDAMEGARLRPPRWHGALMLTVAAFVLVLMPRSGTWLLLPPALALLFPGRVFARDPSRP